MKFTHSFIPWVLAGLLGACGGTGGSDAPPPPPPTATLTSANMDIAAQDAVSAAFTPVMAAQMLTGAQVTDERVLFSWAFAQMDQLPSYMASAAIHRSLAGVSTTETFPCSLSGTLAVTINDADNNDVVSAGDSLAIAANNCAESSGTLSGSLTFAINSLSGGPFMSNAYSAGLTLTFANFTVTGPQFSASANGTLSMSLDVAGQYAYTSAVSTPSLTVSGTYGNVTRTRTLASYSATTTRAPNATATYQTSHSVSGSLSSTALGSQTIAFSTPAAFVTLGADNYPSWGEVLITGAQGAKLRVKAISNTQVTEELDADGNGAYEVGPITVAWSTLI